MENIGRYQIFKEIGNGGMATVYQAYDPQIARTLAIKVLRAERCRDAEYRRRFLRESKAAGSLSHPNIVTIYDIGEVQQTPYIAMEMLDGISLDHLMKSGYPPSVMEIVNWAMQLTDALAYAHQKGIIHRDIKPSNILLSPDKKYLKITDFGIAHFDESEVTQHTQLGEVLGTPQYMSPEQILGKAVDARSDLFSVGVILYQLLTGQKPFQADTLATLLFQIASEDPVPIGQLAPALPGELKQIVDCLLKKKPEKRFSSSAELKLALQKVATRMEQAQGKPPRGRVVGFKWLTMGLVSLMMAALFFLYQLQFSQLNQQLSKYGTALSQLIAFDTAEMVLSEDWASVELFVQEMRERQVFKDLVIVDHNQMVRGSTMDSLAGGRVEAGSWPAGNPSSDEFRLAGLVLNGQAQTRFMAPIYFQTTRVGTVYLQLESEETLGLMEAFVKYSLVLFAVVLLLAVALLWFLRGRLTGDQAVAGEFTHEPKQRNGLAVPELSKSGESLQELTQMTVLLPAFKDHGVKNEP